ncbi:hypothetical protein FISHEDRAFT_78170 [Fistulina hepatica ATCC 64428]|nr:hypothetical protein FISHEDRAFT_78170 [Fistulina hepatica ATCC 64428]
MYAGDIAEHADTADLRHVCREWKHVVASLPELHRVVVNIAPRFFPPWTNFWLNTYFIESTDDTPIVVIHSWDFHDDSQDVCSWKRCECGWCANGVDRFEALPGEPKHGLLYVLAETASRTCSVTVFLFAAAAHWLISHTSPDPSLYIPKRVPPFFPILTSIPGKGVLDARRDLDAKKIKLPWRQLRDLSIGECPWEDIRPKSICQFLSMMEDHSGDLSKLATRTPKYLLQLEALDLVLVRDECDSSSYNLLHHFIQARCEHRISTNLSFFFQLNVEFGADNEILSGFIQKLEGFTKEKKLKFSCSCKNEGLHASYQYLFE